ncbi:MAG: hypothetical protein DRZ82_07915 [Thermoprotei archaeon]|nr:MAG: hypothetical protein DRZ82_07915 [Thermoprotei archaeon]
MPVIEPDMPIALVNRSDKLHPIAKRLFKKISSVSLKNIVIPTSALIEYELILRSRGYSEDAIRKDIQAFMMISNIHEIPLTSKVIITASLLREKYHLSYFDSLHAASALAHDRIVISVDKCYRRIPDIKLIDPGSVI